MVGLMWRDLQTVGYSAGLISTGSQKADHSAAMMAWMKACPKSTAIHLAVMLANRMMTATQLAEMKAGLKSKDPQMAVMTADWIMSVSLSGWSWELDCFHRGCG